MEATVFSGRPEMQPDYTVGMNGSVKTVAMTETGHKKKDWVVVPLSRTAGKHVGCAAE